MLTIFDAMIRTATLQDAKQGRPHDQKPYQNRKHPQSAGRYRFNALRDLW